MRDGKIAAQGKPQELNVLEFDPTIFQEIASHKNDENENLRRRKISRISTKSISIASLTSEYDGIRRESEFDPGLIESLQFYEESARESQQTSPFKKYFLSGAKPIILIVIVILFISAQIAASGADYWVSFW